MQINHKGDFQKKNNNQITALMDIMKSSETPSVKFEHRVIYFLCSLETDQIPIVNWIINTGENLWVHTVL